MCWRWNARYTCAHTHAIIRVSNPLAVRCEAIDSEAIICPWCQVGEEMFIWTHKSQRMPFVWWKTPHIHHLFMVQTIHNSGFILKVNLTNDSIEIRSRVSTRITIRHSRGNRVEIGSRGLGWIAIGLEFAGSSVVHRGQPKINGRWDKKPVRTLPDLQLLAECAQ